MMSEDQQHDDTGPIKLTATSRATIQERLATIERAVLSSPLAQPNDVRRHDARREAHKLAGSLDIFGLTHAADLAGEIERLLQAGDDRTGRGRELLAGLRHQIEQAFIGGVEPGLDEPDTSVRSSRGSSVRILVADDDDIMARMIEAALRRQGYDVVRVRDGTEAVSVAARQPFDLILLDLQMPVMDGFDACRALRSDGRLVDVPIVVLTAQSNEQQVRDRNVAGVTDYLIKPFGVAELRARVRDWLTMSSREPRQRT
jgi:CheY-like chemotaxis protein/HPt (histidine-containing phosphotransfer) domain-containing protein